MATDPTQRITRSASDSPLVANVQAVLGRLAAISPSPTQTILTVMLDWRADGNDPGGLQKHDGEPDLKRSQLRNAPQSVHEPVRRPARLVLERELTRLIEEHGPRGDTFDNLTADAERILAYLDGELDPSALGVVIVACTARDIFEAVSLALPVPTRIELGPLPALSVLARVEDDYPTYAVLLADQHDATLSFITYAVAQAQIVLESTDYPRKQQQGGWSQRRFQQRADERVEAFARDIAEETRMALDELGVDMLILAGDEVITSALDASFHQSVQDRVIATLRLDIQTSDSALLEASLPVAEQAARDREVTVAQRLQDAIGAGAYGASGASDVLAALQAGQVETLVMVDDFTGAGWADFGFPAFGTGDLPRDHPLGGNSAEIVPVELRETLVYLALTTHAQCDIIHSAAPVPDRLAASDIERGDIASRLPAAVVLDNFGGVGAILRFAMDIG